MSDPTTLGELLAAQGERKLEKLRRGIAEEINRLGTELKIVDDALNRKRREKLVAAREKPVRADLVVTNETGVTSVIEVKKSAPNGSAATQFKGLSREDLLAYVVEIARPVSAPDVQRYLVSKGIVRNREAVRVSLTRLVRDGSLVRRNGLYSVPSQDRDGDKVEAGEPLSAGLQPRKSGEASPGE